VWRGQTVGGVRVPKMDCSPDAIQRASPRCLHDWQDDGHQDEGQGGANGGEGVEQLSATRSELIARRLQIGLATQGRDLLKEKRAALMVEFGHLSTGVLEAVETLGRRAAEGAGALSNAVAFDGPEAVGSAAIAASGDIDTRLSLRIVAGVPVVELEHDRISRARTSRGYGLVATSPRIDVGAAAFEKMLDLLLDVAGAELSLRRLAGEISRTTRRVNALEHVVVPRLEQERDAIEMVLAERELEDRIRLRRARAAGRRKRLQEAAA
jgi:V/A-type H+/Na+-transporting ATPase subunit D